MKEKLFTVLQIGDRSNHISRLFDIFITITIFANIIVTFMETFEELSGFSSVFRIVEIVTIFIFCLEYILRIWTAGFLHPDMSPGHARLHFLFSFDGIIDFLTIVPASFLSGFVFFRMLRVARIFHLFRLNAKYDSFNVITTVLYEKKNQIISSLFIVLILMLAHRCSQHTGELNDIIIMKIYRKPGRSHSRTKHTGIPIYIHTGRYVRKCFHALSAATANAKVTRKIPTVYSGIPIHPGTSSGSNSSFTISRKIICDRYIVKE